MGGTQAAFEASQQYQQASKELDEVQFFVNFREKNNPELLNLDILHKNLSKEISNYLSEAGIRYKDIGPVGGLGGGLETLGDILRAFWDNKDIIKFVISLSFFTKTAYITYLNNNIQNLKPRANIYLWIETKSNTNKLNNDDLKNLLSKRLANLLLISISAVDSICNKNKYLCFDVSVEGKVNTQNYSLRLSIPHEQRNEHNTSRLLRIIKDLRVKKSYSGIYSLTNWYAIHRRDMFIKKTPRNYYLFISSKIITDYFK